MPFFYVQTPEVNLTWIGGPLVISEKAGKVSLTKPSGEKLLEVAASCVTEQTPRQAAQTLADDARQRRERN
jgi:hypothetical protein